jgi:hypothetical protein
VRQISYFSAFGAKPGTIPKFCGCPGAGKPEAFTS